MEPYYSKYGGSVLCFSINFFVYITIHERFERGYRIGYSRNEEVDNIEEIQHPLVRHTLKKLGIEHSLEITSIADVPSRGSGLGSSSAFTVGLIHALYREKGIIRTKAELAAEACEVEIRLAGEPIGKQDQFGTALGGINFVEFNTDSTVSIEPISLSNRDKNEFLENLLLFYTGITRDANPLLREQSQKTSSDEKVISNLHEIREMSTLAKQLLMDRNYVALGKLLDASWKKKKSLNQSVTNSHFDKMYDLATRAGAWGGKILGAGGGGFMLFVAPKESHSTIVETLKEWRHIDFDIDFDGTTVIYESGDGR
jgi:D-glycero-alpha-D-manno-heptose-7-phosphate kinase